MERTNELEFLRRASPWIGIGAALIPFAIAGYFFDDIHNSVTRGGAMAQGMTLWAVIHEHLREWVVRQGRLFPLGIALGTTSWWIFDSLHAIQFFRTALALLNVFFLYRLLRCLSPGNRLPALIVLSLSLVLQFNPRWDGLSSFTPLNQAVLLFVLASWWCLVSAIDEMPGPKRRILGAISIVSTACALLTYEIGLASIVGVSLILVFRYQSERRFIAYMAGAFLVVAAAFVLTYLYFRIGAQPTYDGIQSGSLAGAPTTLLTQLASAFPLAFFSNTVLGAPKAKGGALVLFFVLLLLCWSAFIAGRDRDAAPASNSVVLALGGVLCLFPAAVISISSKYQQIIRYGDPYIVVYMQYFGAAIILGVLIHTVARRVSRPSIRWFLCIILAVISAMTIAVNMRRVQLKNDFFTTPRNQMEQLLATDFMKNVTEGTLLLVDSVYPWESEGDSVRGLCSAFYTHHLGRPIRCMGLQSLVGNPLKQMSWPAAQVMFMQRSRGSDGLDVITLRGGRELATARLSVNGPLIARLEDARPVILHWLGDGFYGWEPAGRKDFSWARATGELHIWNPNTKPVKVELKLMVQSAVDQRLTARLAKQSLLDRSMRSGEEVSVSGETWIAPGSSIVQLSADGMPATAKGDPRTFSFRITSIDIQAIE